MTSLRRAAFALAIGSLTAGCPALVYDPPYRVAGDDSGAAGGTFEDGSFEDGPAPPSDGSPAVDAMKVEPDGGAAGGPDSGCPGVLCAGVCMAAGDCSACSGNTSLCLATRTCQPSCAGCGSGVACLLCASGGAAAGAATACGDECLTGGYPHCACSNVGECGPMGTKDQTCLNGMCSTCGEANTGGQVCAGKCPPTKTDTCVQASASCSCQ